ncbi:MAG: response regulator [Deltaproteobacteria bacterium]|nr:response regulator [Deltaproteobacteria bacterium]
MKTLRVDDDPVTRALLGKMLADFADCETAARGAEAIDRCQDNQKNGISFDIITLDISMPDTDEKQVLRKIHTIEAEKHVPKYHFRFLKNLARNPIVWI